MKRLSWFIGLWLLWLNQLALAANPDTDFLNAREAFRVGNAAKLNAAAARLNGYVLYPYVAYWQLQSRLRDASGNEIREFLDKYADSAVADRLRADWLRLLGKNQQWDQFLSEYPNLVNGDIELNCLALRARVAKGDTNAVGEAIPWWFTGRDLPEACTPLFDQLIADKLITEEAIWARLRLALDAGNVSVARAVYANLGQPVDPRVFDSAADNPQHFIDLNRTTLKSRLSRELVTFALVRLARNQLPQAFENWNGVRNEFTPAEQSYTWAQLAVQAARKHDPAAMNWFRIAGTQSLNDNQLGWKVRTALRAGDWNEVLAAIQAMSDTEQGEGSWRYWKARALKAQGKLAQANMILAPLSREPNFYGQLANEELGVSVRSLPATVKLSEDEIKAVGNLPGIRRALKLYELNLRFEATKEWLWTTRNFEDKHLLAAAELARRNEWYERSINTADKTRQLHDFELRYPAPYRSLMSRFTRERDLDEAWVYGLIRQESRFVTQAKSNVGASGLMQIMPTTAQWVARKLGLRNHKQALTDRMDRNIEFGTYYLKHVLDSLDGQPVLATAAYNAGPVRARRWRDEKPLEGAIYAETIPFSETRDYVKKVMSNAMYYAARFGQKISTLKERLGTIGGSAGNKQDCQADDERSPTCEQQ